MKALKALTVSLLAVGTLRTADARLLGYWNFDGPAAASTTDRLRDLSGNNYHGNDRNYGGGTGANRVLFNNMDLPHAPFLAPPGNENYCLDLTGADRYVIMEGTNASVAANIAAPGAVDTKGAAFNIGNSASLNQPISAGKLTVSFWFKGLSPNAWGNYVAKGGEAYGTSGIPSGTWEGWTARRYSSNSRLCLTTRNFGALTGSGDGDSGVDFAARSGGTLATPQLVNVAAPSFAGNYSDNHASGIWQHFVAVWDGTYKSYYVNGFQIRSESITSGVNVGTQSRLVFGGDENPNTGDIAVGATRFSRARLDEIAIWDEALSPAQIEDLARGADPRRVLRASIRPFDFAWPKGTTSSYSSFYPTGLGAAAAIDGNLTNKYWNTAGKYSGLIVTNAATVAQSFVITTAPDFPERDPATYEVYGTTAAISSADNSGGRAEAWTLLGSGTLALPAARSTTGTAIAFTNATAYTAYKVIFPTLNGGSTMQIGEFRLYASADGSGSPIALTGQRAVAEPSIAFGRTLSPTSPANSEKVHNILDQSTATKWLSWGGATSGFVVTPAAASTVQSFKITTANDSAPRDPSSYELYGTNDPIKTVPYGDGSGPESWTLISKGRLNLPLGRNTAGPIVSFANATSYTSYKVVFPTNSGDTLFQMADMQLYSTTDGTGAGILAVGNDIRPFNDGTMVQNSAGSFFAGYTGGPILPQGGVGTVGLYEMRANGSLKRPEGTTTGSNGTVYANESPILYARWGSATAPTAAQYGVANYPFGRSTTGTIIDYGDDNASVATGFNGIQTEFLTTSPGTAHDQYYQMIQGCFRVAAPGRYTFTMKGDDGSQLAIAGARWVTRYSDNGSGSIIGELCQNGFPTGDTNDIAVVEFPAAGDYNFRYQYNEQGGGAWNEVLYAQGEYSSYDGSIFKQIGDPAGGLQLVDHKPIVDIQSSAIVVTAGSPSTITLSWDACYATAVSLNGGIYANQDVTSRTVNGYGTATIAAPATTTTYTVTGSRNGGASFSKSVTVYVDAPPAIFSFTADDSTLLAGAPLTLRWTAVSGVTFTLNNGVTNTDVTANTTTGAGGIQSGSITVAAPSADTTYSLTASNTNGTSTPATVLIDIGLPPVVSFTTDKASILPGSFVTLNWTVAADSLSQTITPRLNQSSLSTDVPQVGSSVEQPQRTTTYSLVATNQYGAGTTTVTVTTPDRLGVSAAGWTVEVDYWNRFGYTDPAYGSRTALNMGLYQVDEMFSISDAALGERGPLATTNISTSVPTMAGPATPPNAQPGTGEKVLMRYRQTNVAQVNYDDALAAAGLLVGGELRPPPGLTSGVTYDQYALKATATLVVQVPGTYVIGINNDDGGRLRLDLNNDGDFNDPEENLIEDETYHGYLNSLPLSKAVDLQAGSYPIEYVYFEGGGGSGGELLFVDTADNCIRKPIGIISGAAPTAPSTGDVVISEFLTSNSGGLEDYQGSTPDWIELYNGTASAISLNGYYLTDAAGLLNKWAFPPTASIPAGGYLIVFASGKAANVPPPPAGELHTSFSLTSGAGYLALTKDNGMGGYTVVDDFNYPAQRANVSYGMLQGSPDGYNAILTPSHLNMGGATSLVTGDTHFSIDRGIKTAAFALEITADDATPGTVIRYTTDGSTPTHTNGLTYTAPLNISATTVVRARAMRLGAVPTNTDTHTYIFLDDVLTQNTVQAVAKGWPNQIIAGQYFDYGMDSTIVAGHEAEVKDALKAIPTVSMVTDITNLTDPNCGIFVESQFRGRGFERPCSIELINDKGDLAGNFQIDSGVRSRGGFSRNDGNPKHSWHLYFRNDPGYEGRLQYPIYGDQGAGSFTQIDLATANNYSWSYSPEAANIRTFSYTNTSAVASSYTFRYNTMIRDIASRDLQRDMSGISTRNKYCHLYINGIYWGIHYLQERPESSFAETYIGGDNDNYDVVKSAGNSNNYLTESTDGTYIRGITGTPTADGTYISDWSKLYGGALDLRQRDGLTVSQAADDDRNVRFYKLMGYDYNPGTQTAVRNPALPVLLDVNNLIDYMLVTFYCGAYDAPVSTFLNNASNNWWALRDRTGSRGFVYIAWDFEHGMGSDMLSGDYTSGVSSDIDYSAGVNSRFVVTTTAVGTQAGFRSTNRLGPWGMGPQAMTPRSLWPTNQYFKGAFSATNPEFYENNWTYNNANDLQRANPQYLHEFLAFAPEYRRMFADRAQCMLRQNGPLVTANVIARINQRAAQLDPAIIAESARWGNAKGVALANYNKAAWLGAVQNLRDWVTQGSNQHILNSLPINGSPSGTPLAGTGVNGPGRAEVLISQLKVYKDGGLNNVGTAGPYWVVNSLFPGLDAPLFGSWGGVVSTGYNLTVTNPNGGGATGTIYYTLDGSDPRPLGGGAPIGTALTVASGGSIVLTATGTVHARVYDATGSSPEARWSAMAKADFIVGVTANASNLAITEINYNPKAGAPAAGTPTGGDVQTFEFIELLNTSAGGVDLSGVKFTAGIDYTFPTGRVLAPGERIVVAKDLAAFASRYPDSSFPGLSGKTVGPFTGNLANGGEQIVLTAQDNSVIRDITFDDSAPWPTSADGETGQGRTIFLLSPDTNVSQVAVNDGRNWRSNAVIGGNPGGADVTSFDAWIADHGIAAPGDDDDSDVDGATALMEFALGTDPGAWSGAESPIGSSADFTVGALTDRYLTFSFSRNVAAPGITYTVQTNQDLQPTTWTPLDVVLVSTVGNNDGTETVTYRSVKPISDLAEIRRYIRLKVVRP